MGKYLPRTLVNRLDAKIRKNELAQPQFKSAAWLIAASFVQLVLAIMQWLDGGWGWTMLLLFLCLSTFIIGGWDLLTHRRTLHNPDQTGTTPSTATTQGDLSFGSQNPAQLHRVNDFADAPTKPLETNVEQIEQGRDQTS